MAPALAEALEEFRFRLLSPDAPVGDDGFFHFHRANGSIATLISTAESPLENAVVDFGAYDDQLKERLRPLITIRKMSRLANAGVLNLAVSLMRPDHAFVNVGVWRGFTLLAAMADNQERICVGVDDFSEFGGPREEFMKRFEERRARTHRFHSADYVDFFAAGLDELLGVYLYDGEHNYENQYRGLMIADPFYAEDAVIVVDDTNLDRARNATLQFVADSRLDWSVIYDRQTAAQRHPTLWNGLMILQAGASAEVEWPTIAAVDDRLVPHGAKDPRSVSVLALAGADCSALARAGHQVVPVPTPEELPDALEESDGDYVLFAEPGAVSGPKRIDRAIARARAATSESADVKRRGRRPRVAQ